MASRWPIGSPSCTWAALSCRIVLRPSTARAWSSTGRPAGPAGSRATARKSMARAEAPEDPTASAEAAAIVDVPPEIVAQSLGEWFRAWLTRLRAGESGVLPVVLGLVIISIVFTAISPVFLSAGNLVNLFQQSAVFR